MNEVNPVSSSNPVHRPSGNHQPPAREASGGGVHRENDSVEFSETANLLAKLANLPETREGLVNSVRSEIADDSYLSDEKIDATVDALFEVLQD
ncbi:MAG: flagellar biosynthesis anti-sigma factor FlgM [Phycisphaeraceae bacterium]